MQHRARTLRRRMSAPEQLLWSMLRNRRLDGLKFRRQQAIGPFVVDFYCEEARLAIELDGESHVGRGDADAARTHHLESRGVSVVRIMIDDLINDRSAVAEHIVRCAGRQE